MKRLIPLTIVVLVIATTPTLALAHGTTTPWVIIQHQVVPADTYPTLDSNYNVAPGTVYGMNDGAVLYVGTYINVPTRAGYQPRLSSIAPGLKPGKSYPPGYNANLWD